MALTRVSPALFQVSNNITSVTVGGSANTISLTFDSNGVITGASNNAVSVANTAITGNIISSQIASVNGSVITANTIANSAIQTGAVENYMRGASLDFGMRNRIINGAMVIDQRNAGATLTLSGSSQFAVDRFVASKDTAGATCTAQRSTTSTTGFVNSFLWTTTTGATSGASDESVIWQNIEGYNVADLAWGTASAATVTLSFWVRSSLTGTFGVSFRSPSGSRNYVGSYTINSANTFEYKTVTVAGDTTGTWATDNSTGLRITWDMGCGTSKSTTAGSWGAGNLPGLTGGVKVSQNTGATFYLTGVQLEKGSTATSFDYRPYGTELQLCQRYYQRSNLFRSGSYYASSATTVRSGAYQFVATMRAAPSITFSSTSFNNASGISTDGIEVSHFQTYCNTLGAGAFTWEAVIQASAEL